MSPSKRPPRRGLAALFAGVLFAAGLVASHSPAGGAPARTCYDCHTQSKQEYRKKFVHAPVAKNDCGACHMSHGFAQKLVLKKKLPDLCFDCHGDLAKAKPAHPHPAFASGGCLGCHEPHATDAPHLVRAGGPEASCFKCHAAAKQEMSLADVHPPFRSGDCGACHAPHGSAAPGLLKAEGDALCAGCHAAPQIEAAHAKVVRGALACLDCHAAHASSSPKLARAGTHPPVAEGQCEACHASSDGKPTAKLIAEVPALCVTCHDEKAGLDRKPHPHPPAAEGQCLTCHDPHRGEGGALLRDKPNTLCGTCHGEVAEAAKLPVVHPPFAKGECSACHEPHGSDRAKLVKSDDGSMCLGCHQDLAKRLAANSGTHPPAAKKDCLRCHAPHASENLHLLRREGRELCTSCHAGVDQKVPWAYRMAPARAAARRRSDPLRSGMRSRG